MQENEAADHCAAGRAEVKASELPIERRTGRSITPALRPHRPIRIGNNYCCAVRHRAGFSSMKNIEVDVPAEAKREPLSPADKAEFRRLFAALPVKRQHRMFVGFFLADGGAIH